MIVCNIDLETKPCKGKVEYGATASMSCDGPEGHDAEHYKFLYAVDGSGRTVGTATGEQIAAIFKATEEES